MEAVLVALVAVAGLVTQHFALRRAQAQVDAVLARVSTEPRLEIREVASKQPTVNTTAMKYISDEPYHDDAWNEYRGVTADGDGEAE